MTRTDAREFMMQVAYQIAIQSDYNVDNKKQYFGDKKLQNQKEYCDEIYSLLCNKREEIDSEINKYSKGWKASRMAKTDLAIVRVAICELLFFEDIPSAVSINEAVDLAKTYGTDEAPKFINAILGKIAQEK